MANTITLTIPDDHTPVDLLLWNYFKREYPDLIDQTFSLNPGLASLGEFPPVGTKVVVQLPNAPKTRKNKPLITLWSKAT